MKKAILFSIFLVLCLLLPVFAHATDGWVIADRLEQWNLERYDLSKPAFFGGENDWQVQTKYYPDPENANAMLLELRVLDENGNNVVIRNTRLSVYLPYPRQHDAAMGYQYEIEKTDTGAAISVNDIVETAVAFDLNAGNPNGVYRISWDRMSPRAASWGLVMTKMDWSGNSCRYTVGAGSKKISVERQDREITISGGEIYDNVHFVDLLDGIDDFQEMLGWHTESGSYTFHNVTLHGITVHAQQGENYKITLEASVKGNYSVYCDLRNGANLHLINNDIIRSDYDYSMVIGADTTCSMTITGNGKILEGNGWLYQEDLGMDILDKTPIFVGLTSVVPDMDDTTIYTNEAALADIKAFEGRVTISYDQVKKSEGFPFVRSRCEYLRSIEDGWWPVIDPRTGEDYTLDSDYIVKKLRPAKGVMTEPVAATASELDESALFRPLMVINAEGEYYLRSEITQESKDKSINYEIHMVDVDDELLPLSQQSALYIPYPEGRDLNRADRYQVTIRHRTDTGDEVFSTQDGTIELTPYGFRILVSSLSPFEVSYTTFSLPATGDSFRLGLCVMLFGLSLASVLLMSRRTARR